MTKKTWVNGSGTAYRKQQQNRIRTGAVPARYKSGTNLAETRSSGTVRNGSRLASGYHVRGWYFRGCTRQRRLPGSVAGFSRQPSVVLLPRVMFDDRTRPQELKNEPVIRLNVPRTDSNGVRSRLSPEPGVRPEVRLFCAAFADASRCENLRPLSN